jgi:hypothetical protein
MGDILLDDIEVWIDKGLIFDVTVNFLVKSERMI